MLKWSRFELMMVPVPCRRSCRAWTKAYTNGRSGVDA